MAIKHPASALGEAIGKIIEDEIERCLRPICEKRGYYYDRGGARSDVRNGVKLTMVNKSGNTYQLDAVIENSSGKPVIILESKYLRYKKHNRDKASWTCACHYSLRKSHSTIRKSIAVISGNWSKPAKAFMDSFGIELHEVPFDSMCKVLSDYGINFDWEEKDSKVPRKSWIAFRKLTDVQYKEIGMKLLAPIRMALIESVRTAIEGGEDWVKRIQQIELLLKTDRNEYFTSSFSSVGEAIQFLLKLQIDAPDLRGKI